MGFSDSQYAKVEVCKRTDSEESCQALVRQRYHISHRVFVCGKRTPPLLLALEHHHTLLLVLIRCIICTQLLLVQCSMIVRLRMRRPHCEEERRHTMEYTAYSSSPHHNGGCSVPHPILLMMEETAYSSPSSRPPSWERCGGT